MYVQKTKPTDVRRTKPVPAKKQQICLTPWTYFSRQSKVENQNFGRKSDIWTNMDAMVKNISKFRDCPFWLATIHTQVIFLHFLRISISCE